MALFVVLLWQGLMVFRRCHEPAGQLLAFGITFILGFQAAMNIAVVTVSVPTKGISLPLVSGGGSGVIFLGALVGVLANIAKSSPSQISNQEPLISNPESELDGDAGCSI